jgi:hypothetical protein
VIIRPADAADVPRIVEMGLAFRRAHAAHLRENPGQMAQCAYWLIGGGGVLLVAEAPGSVLVGMLGLALITHPLSGDQFASELFWWVEPDARSGSRTGLRLLDAAESWARKHHAIGIHMVALASNPHISRLYAKRGYTERDSTWERTL